MASALLDLLNREDQVIISALRESSGRVGADDKYGEGFGEYYGGILDTCLRYCDKQGLLALLLRDASSGSEVQSSAVDLLGVVRGKGFNSQQRVLIDSALVAAAAEKRSFLVRQSALGALGEIVRTDQGLSAAGRSRIHGAFVKATLDDVFQVRAAAVRALAKFGDKADLPILRQLAASDTARSVRGSTVTYPVREEAAKAIAKIPPR